jgi:phosphoribosylglycinamide formyltransferase 2
MPTDVRIATAGFSGSTRLLLLGAGELGKEVAIEAQRLGIEVIAVDRYAGAPAMQIAHRSHVIDMTDAAALGALLDAEQPHYLVPEVEAIATEVLVEREASGLNVVPSARAVTLTMNREGLRRLAAEELGLPTSPYCFVESEAELRAAAARLGFPCVVKPIMSSSGKGQRVVRQDGDCAEAWQVATEGGRVRTGRVIVEGFIDFDYEITLLTVQHRDGITTCEPIGHRQEEGDYRESWQPQAMSPTARDRAEEMAREIVHALGGHGIFGVEFFVKGDEVWFSEVSPRPHDTGLVTLASQQRSQFLLHVLALLGLPIPDCRLLSPAASAALVVKGSGRAPMFTGLAQAAAQPQTQLRIFGKPEVQGARRMAVAVSAGTSVEEARRCACAAVAALTCELAQP